MRPELENLPQPNWFWHGEQILGLVEKHRPVVCVELGTNKGCSAIATVRLLRQWGGYLTCVDRWMPDGSNLVGVGTFAETIITEGVSASIHMIVAETDEAARRWQGEIDYLYIDADHTFESCTLDLEMWWPHLRVGGLIAGDDYDDPYDTEVPKRVTRAWDTFEQKYGQAFERTVSPELQSPFADRPASRLIWGIKQ